MSTDALAGCGVLVTRPRHQAEDLAHAIENAGGTAIRFPVIEIIGRDAKVVSTEYNALPEADVVLFVSKNAAYFGREIVIGDWSKIGAIGPATKNQLEGNGLSVSIFPTGAFDSEHLLTHPELSDVDGKRVTIVRGERGRALLGDELEQRGADVSYLSAYRRQIRDVPETEIVALDRIWRTGGVDFVTALSVESFENLMQLIAPSSIEFLQNTPLVAPSSRVIQTALERLPNIPVIEATGPRNDDIINALVAARDSGKHS